MTCTSGCEAPEATGGRLAGDRGSGVVAGITLIFAFTFLGLVWLARDVDRSVTNRSTASSVAFQAARSGAQAADIPALRAGDPPRLDPAAARRQAEAAAARLFDSYDVDGDLVVVVGVDEVTATVTIDDGGRRVTGTATVRAERTP